MILGVSIINLVTHSDSRGFFREIFRMSENFPGLKVEQISHSRANRGVVKGWHGHVVQSQWNYVLSGEISVALLDWRQNSDTKGTVMNFVAGENSKICYFFPPGIFHAYRCNSKSMDILYCTSGKYDLKDEVRFDFGEIGVGPNF